VLLVSRNSATGTDGPNGLGIAVLDGNTGIYLGKLSLTLPDSSSISSGVGLFKLNMIEVAEDGVIYACALQTSWSSSANYVIYRWQTESADPTIACSTPQLGTATRVGDDFCVRGSGAGTQIIASGNTAVTNISLFTTLDGTNFTGIPINVTGLPANSVRLGLAFGCGNTFYGETTGSGNPMRYVTFTGAPATTASLTASYTITDNLTNQAIGPIGVDIPNQRVVGDATSGSSGVPHSMNLYDLNTLAVTPTVNLPIDTKTFAVSVGTFGTGSVDFTPDGSRLYTLDSGSGVIAFSLVPKLAAPTICAQPQKFMAAPTNSVGFMDVMAIGSPQTFQWRFSGTNPANTPVPVANATNRTLDLYNLQQSQLGYYSVVITNNLGSATSSVALLDITMLITNPPSGLVVTQGDPAVLSVGVDGGARPLSYQWRLNNVAIAGATGSAYTIPHADFSNAAYNGYSVVATDIFTQTVASASVTLNVLPPVQPAPGTGTGLRATIYTNIAYTTTAPPDPFTSFPVVTRIDPTVDFDFGTGSPDGSIGNVDYFQIRWNGQVQPLYSQTYTFFTTSDDGQRLWVNGVKLIDDWTAHGPTERSASIPLAAPQKYDVVYEFYEKTGGAVAKLWWWSASQVKTNVPMEQLYPAAGPLQSTFSTSLSNGTNLVLNWVGTCVLQSAPAVTGPWTPIATNAGPFTVNMTGSPQLYYRLLSQQF